jgi:nickel transport protein
LWESFDEVDIQVVGKTILRILTVFVVCVCLSSPSLLHAHGVRGKLGSGGIVVTAEYDTGEPMSYARVEVSAPNTKIPFQSGRTDRNGCFVFFPDAKGMWKVAVDDEIGHRLEMEIPIDAGMKIEVSSAAKNVLDRYLSKYDRIFMGICLILAISGSLAWYKGWQYHRRGLEKAKD